MFPITITKSRKVPFTIWFLQIFIVGLLMQPWVLLCKYNRQKLETWKTYQITLTYLIRQVWSFWTCHHNQAFLCTFVISCGDASLLFFHAFMMSKDETWYILFLFLFLRYLIYVLHRLWYLVSHALFAKGLHEMPRSLKVSHPLIVDTIPFVNISNFFKWKVIYIMTFKVAR